MSWAASAFAVTSWLGALASALPAQSADALLPPERFERVLWCADFVHGLAPARALGFTAVQLGRGADPAPVLENGLRFYLDQPIGKGVLELRDEQWAPLVRDYERTRDQAALVRPGCYVASAVLAQAVQQAADEARRVAGPGLLFVALADEPSATRHDAPLDTCHCEHCLREFRMFVTERFRTVGALNAALGTSFSTLADALPPSTDALRRRELGQRRLPADLRPFAVAREFVDQQYATALHAIARAVAAALPGVPVGVTGTSAPAAFGGADPRRVFAPLTLIEPYDIGGAVELTTACAAPAAHRYTTIAAPAPETLQGVPLATYLRARLVAEACRGTTGAVVWNDSKVLGSDGMPTEFGKAVTAAFQAEATVLDACAGAQILPSSLWVLESQASVRAWWMLDSVGDGMTWVRRFASYEAEHSTSQASRTGWLRLLQDLGHQPRFVGEDALAEQLLQQAPRCLVLPACLALSDRATRAIRAYVDAGGVVLADFATGLYDEQLLRREVGGLDELFGITARSLDWDDLLVREGRATAESRDLPLAEAGLRGLLAERRDRGDVQLERELGRGRAVYLNTPVVAYDTWRLDEGSVAKARDLRRRVRTVLERARLSPPLEVHGEGLPTVVERTELRLRDGRRVFTVRLQALARPAVLAKVAAKGPRPVVLEWPAARHFRLLGGQDLGTTARFELALDPFGALFVEVVP